VALAALAGQAILLRTAPQAELLSILPGQTVALVVPQGQTVALAAQEVLLGPWLVSLAWLLVAVAVEERVTVPVVTALLAHPVYSLSKTQHELPPGG
jgi:hypothetical protein